MSEKTIAINETSRDRYLVQIRSRDRDAVRHLARRLDDLLRIERPTEGDYIIEALVDKAHIDMLKREGWDVDVGENLSAIGRERQKEISKIDPFEGGKRAPKGLGRKG